MTLAEWRQMLEDFVAERTDGPAFERAFLDGWRAERDSAERTPYAVDLLFYEVDAYSGDPALRGPGDNDDAQLRAHAARLLLRLDEPWPKLPGSPSDEQIMDTFRRAAARLGLTRT